MDRAEVETTAHVAFERIADSIVQEISKLRTEADQLPPKTELNAFELLNKQIAVLDHYLTSAVIARTQIATLQQLCSEPRP